jgi:tRNA pseudouridine55 synthase
MVIRSSINNYKPDFVNGELILIDKQIRKTSFDVVYKIRKAIGIQKVGHTGTLDPMATGLLIVCTGKMTKEIARLQGLEKTYTGIITVGKTTPSFDTETEFDSEAGFDYVTEEMILKTRDSFIGKNLQKPPMYSAVKHNGKALYKYARKGVEIERESREINISEFEITGIDLPDLHFKLTCSSGTYVRVIAHDFGRKLGCGAYLKSLRRTNIDGFNVEDALTIPEFLDFTKKYFSVPTTAA